MLQHIKREKAFAYVGAILGIFAVCFQLILFINARTTNIGEVIIRFFSYFTILSNIAVALCFFANANGKKNQLEFWKLSSIKTAILVYILVVGIVYNVMLRSLWTPTGAQKIVDELLHVLMPFLFLLYWWLFVPKTHFNIRHVWNSLIFPLIYLIWVLIRGAVSNWYPYPFVDVFNHGYQIVGISCAILLLVFGLLALFFFWWLSKKNTHSV